MAMQGSLSGLLSAARSGVALSQRAYTTSASEAASVVYTGHYKITQTRSAIGVPKSTIKVLKSLGLGHRIGRPVFQPQTPIAAGKILKVKEMVKIENMPGPMPAEGYQRARATKGYKVVGKMM
ncbi:hypothetical protein BGW38_000283 [Lunasporangiospora selenospora]|uniref:Large ribosomal subunit protein uL30m n=1 Tax=Lunasporangiospora selenospora TaxID=979761 RepID=A0A9P6FV30_9FUNG|nr:hypothetical protein BGW38_000283 [Lunasporangiospora selenospora]